MATITSRLTSQDPIEELFFDRNQSRLQAFYSKANEKACELKNSAEIDFSDKDAVIGFVREVVSQSLEELPKFIHFTDETSQFRSNIQAKVVSMAYSIIKQQ